LLARRLRAGGDGQGVDFRKQQIAFAGRNPEGVRSFRDNLVTQLGVEHDQLLIVAADGGCDVFQVHPPGKLDRVILQGPIGHQSGHAVFFGVLQDMQRGQETRDIARGFPGQADVKVPEVIQVIYILGANHAQDPAFTAVVGGKHRGPVTENLVQFLEVCHGGPGGFDRVHPLIHVGSALKAELVTG